MTTKTNRVKIISSAIRDRDELERIVRETVGEQLAREKWITERDRNMQIVTAEYNGKIDAHGAKIQTNMELLQQWADSHPGEFPKDSRSLVIDGNRLGYRLGQPQPKPLKRLTWKAVVERVGAMADEVRTQFLRIKTEPNKEAMIAVGKSQPELLAHIGVEIVQTETFYLDPAREGQPDKRLTSEAVEA